MVVNPCCGISLKSGARAVAGVEFFTSAAFFLTGLITVQKFANSWNWGDADVPFLLFGIAYLIFSVAQFTLAIFLYLGTNQNNYRHCMKWFLGSWILLLILIAFAVFETFQGRLTANILWAKPTVLGGVSLLKLYCIWVIFEFINDIRHYDVDSTSKTPI